jgi:hypothetical protein
MFRHQRKNRTFIHNLRLATLLSFVAGIVILLSSGCKTTTNCYGSFCLLQRKFKQNYTAAITFFIFTIFFLSGALHQILALDCKRSITCNSNFTFILFFDVDFINDLST